MHSSNWRTEERSETPRRLSDSSPNRFNSWRKPSFHRSESFNSHFQRNPGKTNFENRNSNSSSQIAGKINLHIYTFSRLRDLHELSNKNAFEIIKQLIDQKDDFAHFLQFDFKSHNLVPQTIALLSKVCSSYFRQTKITILKLAAIEPFLSTLKNFVRCVANPDEHRFGYIVLFNSNKPTFFVELLMVCESLIEIIPGTCFHILQDVLEFADSIIVGLRDPRKIMVINETKLKVKVLIDRLDLLKEQLEVRGKDTSTTNEFRTFSAYPISDDLLKPPEVQINTNEVNFYNTENYLDVQFRSLKEIFVAPIRRDIQCIRDAPEGSHDFELSNTRIYRDVVFGSNVPDFRGLGVILNFSEREDLNTIFSLRSHCFGIGTLVFFTKDNFATILIGSVIKRDVNHKYLLILFEPEENYEMYVPYTMITSKDNFMPYYYTMKTLQCLSLNVPMKSYLIDDKISVEPPSYLNLNSVYSIQGRRVKIRKYHWPTADQLQLDLYQYSAFKAALTENFVMIQGDPGTGKTYLGIKIVKTLLHPVNESIWYNSAPILIICLTDQALDHFMECLIPITNKFIRVAYRCKNIDSLEDFTVLGAKGNPDEDRHVESKLRKEMRKLLLELHECNDSLNHRIPLTGVIKTLCFQNIDKNIKFDGWFMRASNSKLLGWLCQGRNHDLHSIEISDTLNEIAEEEKRFGSGKNETTGDEEKISVVKGWKFLWSKSHMWDTIVEMRKELQEIKTRTRDERKILETELKDLWKNYQYFKLKMRTLNSQSLIEPKNVNYASPESMDHDDRWSLYLHWLHLIGKRLTALKPKHSELHQNIIEIQAMQDWEVMKHTKVLGMTIITAARLHAVLEALNCRIVIVEEASEVRECHVLTSLTQHCEHLILFGNLPERSTAPIKTYKFVTPGISIMERMMRNKMPCHALGVQHRMRTEIAKLTRPDMTSLYEFNYSFTRFPAIVGVPSCVYFIHHEHQESEQYYSKTNLHEAKFLIRFAHYLIQIGYEPKDIAIVTAYHGQYYALLDERKCYQDALLTDVRLEVGDKCQGLECKIILLSLVRNNHKGKIGYLESEKYVNFAISRAKEALYMMGNKDLLCQNSEMWKKINKMLEEEHCVGDRLHVCCENNPKHVSMIKEPEDFDTVFNPEGVCNKPCEIVLSCGHRCLGNCLTCSDHDHIKMNCRIYQCRS